MTIAALDHVTYFALYVSDDPGPVNDDDGIDVTCVGLFVDFDDAIVEARTRLAEGFSISIELGAMPQAEWDALEEVPDDFTPTPLVPA